MAKLEIEFEVTGLKLKVKSDKPTAALGRTLGESLGGMLGTGIMDTPFEDLTSTQPPVTNDENSPKKKRSKRTASTTNGNGQASTHSTFEWKHDPTDFGS